MTNEEAIKFLKQLYPYGGHCWLDGQRTEAIGMAIKALKEEPVSEELEKEIQDYYNSRREYGGRYNAVIPVYRHQLADIASHFAQWQKQQLMAKAVDATVHIDAGGYPYIPQMELYDYDKDIPLAKEGDKYKVILIKEG